MKNSTRVYLLILIYIILLVSLLTFTGELISLAIPLIVYLFVGWLTSPAPDSIDLQIEVDRERVSEGEVIEIRLRLENLGEQDCLINAHQSLPVELHPSGDSPDFITTLKPDGRFEISTPVRCDRGVSSIGETFISFSEPLGSHFTQTLHSSNNSILTLPIPRVIRNIVIRPRRTKVYAGTIPANRGGMGNEFFSVKNYTDGDSLQHINWRASAKHDSKYFINQFQQERVAEVAVLVDARSQSNMLFPSISLLNHSVQAAATVASSLLSNGNRVGVLSFGSHLEWTFPGYGRVQRERILYALAKIKAGESQIFNELKNLPVRLFPAGSQLILISPLLNQDYEMLVQLRARGYQLMVISPSWSAYPTEDVQIEPSIGQIASRLSALERNLLLRKLSQAGILVLPWDTREPVEEILNRFYHSPIRWLHAGARL